MNRLIRFALLGSVVCTLLAPIIYLSGLLASPSRLTYGIGFLYRWEEGLEESSKFPGFVPVVPKFDLARFAMSVLLPLFLIWVCVGLTVMWRLAKEWRPLVCLAFCIFAFWLAGVFLVVLTLKPFDWGELGDAFGSMNALFSGLAFAGVVYALWLQQQDLKTQQEMLSKSTEEFQKQTRLFENQLQVMQANLEEERRGREPILEWRHEPAPPGTQMPTLINRGGACTVAEVQCQSGITCESWPKQLIQRGESGQLKFTGFPPNDYSASARRFWFRMVLQDVSHRRLERLIGADGRRGTYREIKESECKEYES